MNHPTLEIWKVEDGFHTGSCKTPEPFQMFLSHVIVVFPLIVFPSAGFTPWPKDSHERGKGKGRVKEGKWKHRKGRGKGKGKEKERERGKRKGKRKGKKGKGRNRRKRKRKKKGKEKERRRKRRRKRKSIPTDTQLEPHFFPKCYSSQLEPQKTSTVRTFLMPKVLTVGVAPTNYEGRAICLHTSNLLSFQLYM